jgi:hypothetical protein
MIIFHKTHHTLLLKLINREKKRENSSFGRTRKLQGLQVSKVLCKINDQPLKPTKGSIKDLHKSHQVVSRFAMMNSKFSLPLLF